MAVKTNPTILVIEDYSDTRKLMASLLRAHGYMVVEAKDGREGFIQANRVCPDLILMDLALPELDGIEATRQIRQRHTLAQTPIFAISAYAISEVKRDALAAGCTEVFAKPVDIATLLEKIRETLQPDRAKARAAATG